MSDMLSLGLSGLRATAKALSTVSDNIANAQTPGYARRSVRIEEGAPGGDNPLYKTQHTPGGAIYGGITRHVDQLLIEDARTSSSAAGQTLGRLSWLEAAERDLDDGSAGVGATATRLFNIADQLATNPSSSALRATFLQDVDDAAGAFRRTAGSLIATAKSITTEATTQVDGLNTDLAALQRVNEGLLRARPDSTNQASLLDERDTILDRISDRLAITTELDPRGMATVRLAGPGRATLVDGPLVAQASVTAAANGQISFLLNPGGAISPQSGSLAGLAQASTHVSNQRASLDTLAQQFANDLNTAHQAGYDANGNPGQPLLAYGGSAAALTALVTSPALVAAADGASSNGNLLSLSSLRGASGVEAGWASLVNGNASAVASARAQDAAASARRDGAWEARDTVSSVDLDTEAAELLRFQQAYQASAKVIQVARETIQTIMNSF